MMQQTKIQLLPAEMELVSSPDIILTKNAILQKIKSFLEEIQLMQQDIIAQHASQLPAEVLKISPKISRGENYKGLPWLVLDNPRYFEKENIFAIRSMFWWGNFFSITLHLSGRYKNIFSKNISQNLLLLSENNFHLYTGQSEWEHDMAPRLNTKVTSVNTGELEKLIAANNFLKLAVKFPIDSLEVIQDELCRYYQLLIKVCG
jgi:hypothetical protein